MCADDASPIRRQIVLHLPRFKGPDGFSSMPGTHLRLRQSPGDLGSRFVCVTATVRTLKPEAGTITLGEKVLQFLLAGSKFGLRGAAGLCVFQIAPCVLDAGSSSR
jgi:hypothetical protein